MASSSLGQQAPTVESQTQPSGSKCFNCGSTTGVGDFCESCGTWLHPGCCRFCYAHLDPGARFCGDCGNDQTGIECPRCHVRSFFDFCSLCYEPLTERAGEEVKHALAQIESSPGQAPHADGAPSRAASSSTPGTVEAASPTETRVGSDPAIAELQAETHADAPIEPSPPSETANSPPQTPQAARAKMMAIRAAMSIKVQQNVINRSWIKLPSKWRCYAFGNLHSSPNECAQPNKGGVWIE